ncbi:MAG: response regulator, partial [Alphaproteobacteria bacterium]|nr:response regulator [Alphaproteobacteria bacterium]
VDDDAMVGAGTVAMLEDLGHSAIEATTAARALEILSSEPEIDIVITDYAMPGTTGSELATQLQQIRPGLPVVIATGYVETAGAASAFPRLNKPYRLHDLAAVISDVLRRKPRAGPFDGRRGSLIG